MKKRFLLSLLVTFCAWQLTTSEYVEVCTCIGIYTPPEVRSNCSVYLSPTCPCPGETQSSEQRELSILVRPEQTELNVRWSATRFDGVRLNLTSVVVNPRTSGVLPTELEHSFSGLSAGNLYNLTFCGILIAGSTTQECGCRTFAVITASNRAPHSLRVTVSEGKISVSWSAPRSSDQLSHYAVMYGPLSSTARKNVTRNVLTFTAALTDILPQTLYGVSVAAVYMDGTWFTLPEDVVLTLADKSISVLGVNSNVSTVGLEPDTADTCATEPFKYIFPLFQDSGVHYPLIDLVPNVMNRQFFYSSTNGRIFQATYSLNQNVAKFVDIEDSLVVDRTSSVNISSVSYDPTCGVLYWIESDGQESKVMRRPINEAEVVEVISSVNQIGLDYTFGYLYWSNSSGVYRCSLNPTVDCRDNSEAIYSGEIVDFVLDKPNRAVYLIDSSSYSVFNLSTNTVSDPSNLTITPSTVSYMEKNIYFLNQAGGFELWNRNSLTLICSNTQGGTGQVRPMLFTAQGGDPFVPPNPPSNFNFIVNETTVIATWNSPSNGLPDYPTDAPWRYTIQYMIGSSGQSTNTTSLEAQFTQSSITPGTPVTISVMAEGQKGSVTLSPQFLVVTTGTGSSSPLLIGSESGVYAKSLSDPSSLDPVCSSVITSITQDIFRDTTYIIDSEGKIARCGGDYTIAVETVPVHGLAVDWVANNLYWIRTDTEIVVANVNTRSLSTVMTGKVQSIAVDPHSGLLFYSSGPRVDFMKLNKLSAMGNTKCNPHTDTVVSMTLDIASERVYWATVRYSRLLLNWADYKNENCSYRGYTVIPELKLSSGMIGCGISVSNGLLAIKVENVGEVWTVDTSVFDVITFTSSPGLRRHPLPQSYSRSDSIAFKNASVAFPTGLMASSIAIPQGLTVAQRDNSSDLNTITIRWSLGVPFVLSEVVYRCSYTLQRTDGVNVTGQTMTSSSSLTLTGQLPYTKVEGTVEAFSLWGSDVADFSFRSSSDVPSVPVGGVVVSVYQSGPQPDDLTAVVNWKKLSPTELRGEFVKYIVEINHTNITSQVSNVLLRDDDEEFQLMRNASYVLRVYAMTNFGLSPPNDAFTFSTFELSPVLGVIVGVDGGSTVVGGNEGSSTNTTLRPPLQYDVLTRVFYGLSEPGTIAKEVVGGSGVEDINIQAFQSEIVSMSLDWISKRLYLFIVNSATGTLEIVEVPVQAPSQRSVVATMDFNGTLSSTISPNTRTLYFATSNRNLYSVKIGSSGNIAQIFPQQTGRRRRQTCINPLPSSVAIGSGIILEGNTGRLWLSDQSSGDIWSCDPIAAGLCNCSVEVAVSSVNNASSLPATSLSLDEERIYWTKEGYAFVFYVERTDPTQVNSIATATANLSPLVINSPALQPLPDDSCLYISSPQPTPRIPAFNITDTSAHIEWNAAQLPSSCTNSIPLPNYIVEYNITGSNSKYTVTSQFLPSVTLMNLTPYTVYTVRVSAQNMYTPPNLVNSLYGTTMMFQTAEGVPSMPRNLSVVVYGTRRLKASWKAPQMVFADPSTIQYRITVNGEFSRNVTRLEADMQSLDPGVLYTIQVFAFNQLRIGPPSSDSASTWDLPPTLESLVLPLDRSNTSTVLQATFTSSHSYIRRVKLQEYVDGLWMNRSNYRVVNQSQVQGQTETFNLTDLTPFQEYKFRLYADYQNLPSGEPFSDSGDTTELTTSSGVPSTPQVRLEGTNLVWTGLSPRSNGSITNLVFLFERIDTQEELDPRVEPYSPEQSSFDLSTFSGLLEQDVRYSVRMLAENDIGRGNYSEPEEFTLPSASQELIIIVATVVCGSVLIIAILVLLCLCMWCCCIHYQNLKHKEEIRRRLAYNRDYDEDIERLRILKFSRDDYRSREDYIFSGNDLEKLVKIPRDKIKLDSHIGQGAFGEVYSGTTFLENEADPVRVAIKVLHKDATEDQERSFLSEAIIMSHFNHENILSVIGVCVNNYPNFIILELMDGGNLLEFIRGARREGGSALLTPAELAKISLDIANGAKYLEALKFIHRDLAARNCLVSSKSEDRVVKIGDFGLAKDLYSAEYYRKEGQGLLPVRWMPPESLQEGLFTTKSDVWAFGITLWEVWTLGFQPYPARTNHEVFDLVIHGGRNERPEKCPSQIYNIMTMCWQQNPEDRPPFLQIVEKLRTFNERLKTESICLDCDSIEDPGEFERGDSGRSWIRGSLRDSIRRIRTSIHRQNSVRGVRRQSSFKGELTTNGQAYKESGPI